MKRKVFAFVAMAFAVVVLTSAASAPDSNVPQSLDVTVVSGMADQAMDAAISLGFGTDAEKQKIQNSRIIEEAYETFRSTGDPAAAVDRAAEVSVEQGWFKNKQSAKRYLRNQLERARKNESLAKKVYNALGI